MEQTTETPSTAGTGLHIEWNPRFVAYAKSQGCPDPDAVLTLDRERWPGGCMCGFTLWMREQWGTWCKADRREPRFPDRPEPCGLRPVAIVWQTRPRPRARAGIAKNQAQKTLDLTKK